MAKREKEQPDYTSWRERAEIGQKRITPPSEPARIGIKRPGRIVLNRASADAFKLRGLDQVLLLRYNNVLFIEADKSGHKDAHKITYGKGGIPGLITARTSLKNLGVNIDKNFSDIPVAEAYERKPGEVGLVIPLPTSAIDPP